MKRGYGMIRQVIQAEHNGQAGIMKGLGQRISKSLGL
jgi:hypothetical protein